MIEARFPECGLDGFARMDATNFQGEGMETPAVKRPRPPPLEPSQSLTASNRVRTL